MGFAIIEAGCGSAAGRNLELDEKGSSDQLKNEFRIHNIARPLECRNQLFGSRANLKTQTIEANLAARRLQCAR
jgi:hypothetical protein